MPCDLPGIGHQGQFPGRILVCSVPASQLASHRKISAVHPADCQVPVQRGSHRSMERTKVAVGS